MLLLDSAKGGLLPHAFGLRTLELVGIGGAKVGIVLAPFLLAGRKILKSGRLDRIVIASILPAMVADVVPQATSKASRLRPFVFRGRRGNACAMIAHYD